MTIRHSAPISVLSLIILAIVASSEARSQALPPSTLTLTLCNKTDKQVDTILVHRSLDDENLWILRGWFSLQAGNNCTKVPGIPRGYFYYYAEQRGGTSIVWTGDARRVCIDFRKVERAIFPKERCLAGEKNVGFREVHSLEDKLELPLFVKQ